MSTLSKIVCAAAAMAVMTGRAYADLTYIRDVRLVGVAVEFFSDDFDPAAPAAFPSDAVDLEIQSVTPFERFGGISADASYFQLGDHDFQYGVVYQNSYLGDSEAQIRADGEFITRSGDEEVFARSVIDIDFELSQPASYDLSMSATLRRLIPRIDRNGVLKLTRIRNEGNEAIVDVPIEIESNAGHSMFSTSGSLQPGCGRH
jgi:hypothetical protein